MINGHRRGQHQCLKLSKTVSSELRFRSDCEGLEGVPWYFKHCLSDQLGECILRWPLLRSTLSLTVCCPLSLRRCSSGAGAVMHECFGKCARVMCFDGCGQDVVAPPASASSDMDRHDIM